MEGTSANTLTDVADVDSSNEAVMVHTLLLHGSDYCDSYTCYLRMVFYTYEVISRL